MVGKVRVAVAVEGLLSRFQLIHDGVLGHGFTGGDRKGAGEVEKGSDATEGSGAGGRFRRLGEDFRPAGPLLGHRNADVGVGFDASGEDDLARSVDDASGLGPQQARMGEGGDFAVLYGHVYNGGPLGRNHRTTFDDCVEHFATPLLGCAHYNSLGPLLTANPLGPPPIAVKVAKNCVVPSLSPTSAPSSPSEGFPNHSNLVFKHIGELTAPEVTLPQTLDICRGV